MLMQIKCEFLFLVFWQHPYVYRVTFATANESSALLIRMFNEKGTLKDLIYKVLLVQVPGHQEVLSSPKSLLLILEP